MLTNISVIFSVYYKISDKYQQRMQTRTTVIAYKRRQTMQTKTARNVDICDVLFGLLKSNREFLDASTNEAEKKLLAKFKIKSNNLPFITSPTREFPKDMAVRPLSKKLRQKAETELNETAGRLEEDLRYIREWLAKQPHLKVRTDDQWLVGFLRGCKFSVQKVKEKLDCYCTMRSLAPEIFSNRDPFLPEIQEILKAGCAVPLTKIGHDSGPTVVFVNCTAFNSETMTLTNIFKVCTMIGEILMLEDDDFVISGVSILVDYKGMSINYLPQCTPTLFKKIVIIGEDSYPFRLKNLNYVTCPPILQSTVQLFKFFLSNKLKQRLFVYKENEFDQIYERIPKEVLPFEMGGKGGSMKEIATFWKEKIESYKEWFNEDEKYGVDESKRVGSPKIAVDFFGVEGSFRKLEVD